ncbi:MAG: glycosyltransferase family 39 protein [Mycobacteriales bacterium]
MAVDVEHGALSAAASPEVARASTTRWAAPVIGVLASLISFIGSWIPAVYGDEAATLSVATRSWSELRVLLGEVDAVHGMHYAVMHVWLAAFGTTPLSLRLPSVLAVGLAAAGVVVLGRRLVSLRAGVFAGLVLAVLPRVTWIAIEGRSSAMTLAAAVWLTVLLLAAADRGSWRIWAAYAVAVALAVSLWIFLVLLVAAHGATLLWLRHRRGVLVSWTVAAAAGGLAASPVVLLSRAQRGQVSWIPQLGKDTVKYVIVEQWFGIEGFPSLPVAGLCWLLIAVALFTAWRARDLRSPLFAVAMPWLVLPTAGLLALSLVSTPVYVPRYVAFSLPAVALLVGAAIAALPRPRASGAALLAVAVLSLQAYVGDRRPDSKDNSDWASVVRIIESNSAPDDAILYGDLFDEHGASRGPARALAYAYPGYLDGLADVALIGPAEREGSLWGTSLPMTDAAAVLTGRRSVWVVYDHTKAFLAPGNRDNAALRDAGFAISGSWIGDKTDVVHLTRSP